MSDFYVRTCRDLRARKAALPSPAEERTEKVVLPPLAASPRPHAWEGRQEGRESKTPQMRPVQLVLLPACPGTSVLLPYLCLYSV